MNLMKRVQRWMTDRCAHCGHRFRWSGDARHSHGGNREVLHAPCIGYQIWRSKADERLDMLAVVCDVWDISDRDVKGVVEMRAADDAERVKQSDRAFRVFYDLSNRTDAAKETA
jgi:hypothetical protein